MKNVFILRWQGAQLADTATFMQRVKQARSHSPGPLVYLAIVPADDSSPDLATRRELGRQLQELLEFCACVHLVLEGEGFRAATQRAVATGMFLLTGRRDRITAHANVSEALSCCQNLLGSPAEILAMARKFGGTEGQPRRAALAG
ncbi:MAG: hypothetical protein ABI895_14685 [Deltaproteobacteria bacterium]